VRSACPQQPPGSPIRPRPCRILRLTERNTLISADVFEQNFSQACVAWAEIRYEHPQKWLEKIRASKENGQGTAFHAAVGNFNKITAGYDFISPGFNGFHLLPLLAYLRREHDVRLLFIAHAPVQHAVELSLVKDLLRPGDVIICPSVNAREILCAFSAAFARHTVVIPHGTPPLPRPEPLAASATMPRKIVSLGRITEDKLIHRQIDALAICRQQGIGNVVMEIAGPCHDEHGRMLGYVNELQARVRRLGLEEQVRFIGPLQTPEEKGALFAGAAVCINLSRAAEESFGKTCAEAVIMGIPVITTRWNGLPETVGACGEIVPLSQIEGRWLVDIDPADCARAMIKLLHTPPTPADFSRQKQLFACGRSGAEYKKTLSQPTAAAGGTPEPAASTDFFDLIPAIRAFSRSERRDMYLAALGILAEPCPSAKALASAAEDWALLAELIFQSVRARGQQLLAHHCKYTPAPPISAAFLALSPCPEPLDERLERRLLADCLRECDSWARELTITRVTALSPTLSSWAWELLQTHRGSAGFLFQAKINRLLAGGDAAGAAQCLKNHLAESTLRENDGPLLLYFLEICRQADCVPIMTDILAKWLASFPDAPQCSALWPVFAFNCILHAGRYEEGKKALAQTERLLPDFDGSSLRAALTALACV